jgi:hypothetical protein
MLCRDKFLYFSECEQYLGLCPFASGLDGSFVRAEALG